ncbi:uncharacterized protein BDV17DRAFT_290430 [Aspergillus undulatus]|uniref:uncharacterized protein n=1 Tax=Aspergillus undulatus TaxID=1810928 RepID=UPI003CCE4A06
MSSLQSTETLATGLRCLTKPPNPTKHNEEKAVDIVAVHGLDGSLDNGSWIAEKGIFWLRDLLPRDLRHARVFAFSYNARALFTGNPTLLESVANSLVTELALARRRTSSTRPLVFIGHGFGGFVVEAATNYDRAHSTPFPKFEDYLKKIIFLSTAQSQSPDIPWPIVLVNCAKDSLTGRSSLATPDIEVLESVHKNAESLRDLAALARKHAVRLKVRVLACYEDVPTPPHQACSVTEAHAAHGTKGETILKMPGCDYHSIARFASREDKNYIAIVSAIKKVLKPASNGIQPEGEKPVMKVAEKQPTPARQSRASQQSMSHTPRLSRAPPDRAVHNPIAAHGPVAAQPAQPGPVQQQPPSTESRDIKASPATTRRAGPFKDTPHGVPPHPRSLSVSVLSSISTSTPSVLASGLQSHATATNKVGGPALADTQPRSRNALPSSLAIQAPTRHLSLGENIPQDFSRNEFQINVTTQNISLNASSQQSPPAAASQAPDTMVSQTYKPFRPVSQPPPQGTAPLQTPRIPAKPGHLQQTPPTTSRSTSHGLPSKHSSATPKQPNIGALLHESLRPGPMSEGSLPAQTTISPAPALGPKPAQPIPPIGTQTNTSSAVVPGPTQHQNKPITKDSLLPAGPPPATALQSRVPGHRQAVSKGISSAPVPSPGIRRPEQSTAKPLPSRAPPVSSTAPSTSGKEAVNRGVPASLSVTKPTAAPSQAEPTGPSGTRSLPLQRGLPGPHPPIMEHPAAGPNAKPLLRSSISGPPSGNAPKRPTVPTAGGSPSMRSSISGPPGALTLGRPKALSTGNAPANTRPTPPSMTGPRGPPAPRHPPAPSRATGPTERSSVAGAPAPSLPRGLQAGPATPAKKPGFLDKLFGSGSSRHYESTRSLGGSGSQKPGPAAPYKPYRAPPSTSAGEPSKPRISTGLGYTSTHPGHSAGHPGGKSNDPHHPSSHGGHHGGHRATHHHGHHHPADHGWHGHDHGRGYAHGDGQSPGHWPNNQHNPDYYPDQRPQYSGSGWVYPGYYPGPHGTLIADPAQRPTSPTKSEPSTSGSEQIGKPRPTDEAKPTNEPEDIIKRTDETKPRVSGLEGISPPTSVPGVGEDEKPAEPHKTNPSQGQQDIQNSSNRTVVQMEDSDKHSSGQLTDEPIDPSLHNHSSKSQLQNPKTAAFPTEYGVQQAEGSAPQEYSRLSQYQPYHRELGFITHDKQGNTGAEIPRSILQNETPVHISESIYPVDRGLPSDALKDPMYPTGHFTDKRESPLYSVAQTPGQYTAYQNPSSLVDAPDRTLPSEPVKTQGSLTRDLQADISREDGRAQYGAASSEHPYSNPPSEPILLQPQNETPESKSQMFRFEQPGSIKHSESGDRSLGLPTDAQDPTQGAATQPQYAPYTYTPYSPPIPYTQPSIPAPTTGTEYQGQQGTYLPGSQFPQQQQSAAQHPRGTSEIHSGYTASNQNKGGHSGLKIAAGAVVGAAVGGLATAGIMSALQDEHASVSEEHSDIRARSCDGNAFPEETHDRDGEESAGWGTDSVTGPEDSDEDVSDWGENETHYDGTTQEPLAGEHKSPSGVGHAADFQSHNDEQVQYDHDVYSENSDSFYEQGVQTDIATPDVSDWSSEPEDTGPNDMDEGDSQQRSDAGLDQSDDQSEYHDHGAGSDEDEQNSDHEEGEHGMEYSEFQGQAVYENQDFGNDAEVSGSEDEYQHDEEQEAYQYQPEYEPEPEYQAEHEQEVQPEYQPDYFLYQEYEPEYQQEEYDEQIGYGDYEDSGNYEEQPDYGGYEDDGYEYDEDGEYE